MKKNIIANMFGKFWSILSNFIFVPIYIKFLGFESYSIVSFTLVISGFMAVLDSGLSSTLSREFSRLDNSLDEKKKIFSTLETFFFIIVGLTILFLFSFSDFITNNWLNLKSYNPVLVSYFVKIVSFEVGFQLLFRFYTGGLLGLEKQVEANLFQVGWGIFRNGLVVLAIMYIPTLEIFFIWQMISTVMFTFLLAIYLRKVLTGQFTFFELKLNLSVFRRIWRFASGILVIGIIASLNTQMDKLVISKLLPVESLGYYTLAISLSGGIYIVVSSLSAAFQPRFTALFSSGRNIEAGMLFTKVNLAVSIVVFSIMSIMFCFAKQLIWVWTGNFEFVEHASYLLPVTSFAYAMLSLQIIPFNVAIANGYTKLNNLLGVVSLFITLPGYFFFIKTYGVLGAAYTFCGVQTITTFVYLFFIIKKFSLVKSLNRFYLKQIFTPFIISMSLASFCSFLLFFIELNRAFMLLYIGLIMVLIFVITSLVLFSKDEIKDFFNIKLFVSNIKLKLKL